MNDFQYLNKCQHIAISVPHVHMDLGKPQRQVANFNDPLTHPVWLNNAVQRTHERLFIFGNSTLQLWDQNMFESHPKKYRTLHGFV